MGIANQQLVRSIDLYPDESMNKQNIRGNIFLSSKHFPRGTFPDFVIVIIAIVMARRISYYPPSGTDFRLKIVAYIYMYTTPPRCGASGLLV